jgi:hypothetical protein
MDVLLDRSLADDERFGDCRVVFPFAISARSSRSRGVSASSGESSGRDRAIRESTTFGSTAEPPTATSRIAPDQLLEILHPFLEENARRSEP